MSITKNYEKGSVVKVWVLFSDAGTGQPVACTPVTLKVRAPNGTVSTIAPENISNPTTGRYEAYLTLSAVGTYYFRFEGTDGTKKRVITGRLDSEENPVFAS